MPTLSERIEQTASDMGFDGPEAVDNLLEFIHGNGLELVEKTPGVEENSQEKRDFVRRTVSMHWALEVVSHDRGDHESNLTPNGVIWTAVEKLWQAKPEHL